MAEFGVKATELSGPSGAGAAPLQPVQKSATSFDSGWMSGARQLMKSAMQTGTAEPTPLEGGLNFYTQQRQNIQQAFEQGAIGAAEMDSRNRSAWSQTLTNFGGTVGHAQLAMAMGKLSNAIGGASGQDSEVERGRQQKAAEDSLIAEGIKRGTWTAAMANDPNMRGVLLNDAQQYAAGATALDQQSKALELQSKQLSMQNASWEHQQKVKETNRKDAAQGVFLNEVGGFSNSMYRQLEYLAGEIKSGKMNPQEAHQEFMLNFEKVGNAVQSGLINDAESMGQFKTIRESIGSTAGLLLDPVKLSAAGDGVFNLGKLAVTNSMVKRDPRILQMNVFRSQMGDNALLGVAGSTIANDMVGQWFQAEQGKSTSVISTGNAPLQTQMFAAVDATVKGLVGGRSPTAGEDQKAVADNVNGLLRDFGKVQDYDKIPLDKGVSFLSGDSMKYAIENKLVDPAAMNNASRVFSNLYEKGLMQRAYTNFNQTIQRQGSGGREGLVTTINNNIRLESSEDGKITVVPTFTEAEFGKTPGARALYFRAVETVNDLNRQMGDYNVALRMGAHLSGRTDYKKFFQEKAASLFPAFMPPDEEFIKQARANGYEYVGGNAANQQSWKAINETVGTGTSAN